MDEIFKKLLELDDILKIVPLECKGMKNSVNRMKYLKIKYSIKDLLEEIK